MTIRRLPQQVADAIAAGEVVERPASVVKELIENSLDAGSQRISVEVRGAGRDVIRVFDDGTGIAREELELAFTRHATSKVSRIEDLEAISTLGFRGEALASIASVARVECRSRDGFIRVVRGEVAEVASAAGRGTSVEVRDLFANTPARLRFLKSDATENGLVGRTLTAYAIAHANVAFELVVDGRRVLATDGSGLRTAAASVVPARTSDELVDVEHATGALRVAGLASTPRLHRANRDAILVSVNRRPVSARQVLYAIEECYRGRLERGRHPVVMVDIEVDAGAVDVNVHPTKREVKFRDEGAVFVAVQRALREALAESASRSFHLPAPVPADAASPTDYPRLQDLRVVAEARPTMPMIRDAAGPVVAEEVLRALGQVQEGYILAESQDGLVLVDQHAAHERVLYNRYRRSLRSGDVARQDLLVPEHLELARRQASALAEHQEGVSRLGFAVVPFGHAALRLDGAPAGLPPGRGAAALLEILDILARGGESTDSDHALAASLACHSAVRFGDLLDLSEQRRLLGDLAAAADAATCPHGRPTRLLLGWHDVKRHFRRNY